MKVFPIFLPVVWILASCQPANQTNNPPPKQVETQNTTQTMTLSQSATVTTASSSAVATLSATSSPNSTRTADGKIQIDWSKIDSGEPAVDKNTFKYSIALDSVPVKNYMQAYHVDAKTAQYNLTVGMAVNEALSKILDQVGTSYVSHELTAGNNSKFIIHTTAKVAPSEHTYIFAEPFAKGLSIPIQLIPDGKK